MIKKNIKEHSMGVLLRHGRPFFVPHRLSLTYEERAMYRWVLKIHGLPINNTHANLELTRYDCPYTHASSDVLFLVRIESRPNINVERQVQTWTPLEVKIVDTISDVDAVEFLRGWMESDRKFNITLEKLDPVGVIQERWLLYGSFIQEMHNEMVYDNTMGPTTIRLNYDYANIIF